MARMSKSELVSLAWGVQTEDALTRAQIAQALDLILDRITDITENGGEVAIRGFGTFAPKHRAARTGRNPATGETIEIAASTTLGFKPSKGKAGT